MDTEAKLVALIVIVLLSLIFGPLIAIWCVNTLFAAGVEYSLLNWFCALLLLGMVKGSTTVSRS